MNKRVQAFLDKMQEKELDGIIINNLKNVYYLTGFWGSNGTVFISRDRQILVTDARYIIAAKQEVTGFEIFAERDELATIAKIAKDMGLSRIGFEDEISVSYYHRIVRLVQYQPKLSTMPLNLSRQGRLKLKLPTSLISVCVSWERQVCLLTQS